MELKKLMMGDYDDDDDDDRSGGEEELSLQYENRYEWR